MQVSVGRSQPQLEQEERSPGAAQGRDGAARLLGVLDR